MGHFNIGPLLLVLGALFASWLKQRRAARERPAAPPSRASADPDESARRVREEIRRKIDQRRTAELREARESAPPSREPPPIAPQDAELDDAAERQEKIFTRMRDLETANAEADRRIAAARSQAAAAREVASIAPSAGIAAAALEGGMLADLRTPSGARRAMVLREVLGPPVGLR